MKRALVIALMLLLSAPLLSLLGLTYGTISLAVRETEIEGTTIYWNVSATPGNTAAWDVRNKIPLNTKCVTRITIAGNNRWIEITPHWYVDVPSVFDYTKSDGTGGSYSAPWDPILEGYYFSGLDFLYLGEESTFRFKTDLSLINWLWENLTDVHEVTLNFNVTYPNEQINVSSSIYGTVQIQPENTQFSLHLNLDDIARSYFEFQDISNTWQVEAGCGDGYISAKEPFEAVFYGVPESVVIAVNETLAKDSYGHVYIKDYVIYKDAGLNWSDLENATPSQIYSRLPERRAFTVLNGVPNPPAPSGLGVYAGHGFAINVGQPEYILHELAHGMGFCDPDPYGDLKTYWSGLYRATYLSSFTNSTWHFEESDFHLWAYMASSPVYLSGHSGPLVLRMKASESRTVSVSIEVALGSVSDASKQVVVGTEWTDVVFIYIPPEVDNLSIVETVFTVKEDRSGLNRVITYYLTVMPQDWTEELNLTQEEIQQIWPSNWTSFPNIPPLSQIPNTFWQQTYDLLTTYNWSSLNPYVAKAQENMQKAMEDAELSRQTNNTCVKWLYSQAAQLRYYASQLYTQAAQAWEEVQSSMQKIQSMPWSFYEIYLIQGAGASWDFASLAAKASEYEAKAAQLETQAALGCPEGFLSGKTGLNPFLGLGGVFGLFSDWNYSNLSWGLFIVGAVLAAIGFIGLLFNQKSWTKMFPIGVVLCVIGLLLMGVI